ncbi:hypothetical protein KUTeg_000487 [Tegillarca granosa]|uniref:PH domain-containing protein n=1 Tax=Tegillarca granosa TaxID=220873 RepID=A0ABQ9G0S6_TEGGR|nr:hypothetical protein KUTeg_000487 [Tegillarca granosa]
MAEADKDPLGAIPLLNYTVSRHQDSHRGDYCFKAEKYQAKTYYFATENREQLTKWVGALNEAALLAKKRLYKSENPNVVVIYKKLVVQVKTSVEDTVF